MISQTLGGFFAEGFARRNVALQKPSRIRPPSFLIMSQDKHRYGIIYCITSRRNGKQYIGKTTRPLDVRINRHFADKDDFYLHRAMREHGRDNFSWMEICSVLWARDESLVVGAKNFRKDVHPISRDNHEKMERLLIRQFGTLAPKGYNLTGGGDGGQFFSSATRKKFSAAQRKAWARPDERAKRSAAIVAANKRPEVKEKRLAIARETNNRPEVKEKMSASQRKTMNRPEVKEKTSAASRKAWARPGAKMKRSAIARKAMNRPGVRAKLSESQRKAMNRPETKVKSSAASRKNWQDPKIKAKRVSGIRKGVNRPESKAKVSAASRKRWKDPKHWAKITAAVADKREARGLTPEEVARLEKRNVKSRVRHAHRKAGTSAQLHAEAIAANRAARGITDPKKIAQLEKYAARAKERYHLKKKQAEEKRLLDNPPPSN